jgi:phosphoglycolate phosphatase
MLDALASHGVEFAVASNKYQAGTESLVERFFGKYDFVKILGQREGQPIKPDPAIVTDILNATPGIEVREVVYCGDSDVDMQTGVNAGVRTIGVTWGFRTREELSAYGPWHLAANAEEIAGAIIADSE